MAPYLLPCSQVMRGSFCVITCCQCSGITLNGPRGGSRGFHCTRLVAVQTELPKKLESLLRFNEQKCLSSIWFLMCRIIMSLMCFSVSFLASLYSDSCLRRMRGRYKHREMEYLRQMWDFTLESREHYLCIRYFFEEPKTCIFPYSFRPNNTDKINYSFVNVYFTSKTSMTWALMLEKLFLQ